MRKNYISLCSILVILFLTGCVNVRVDEPLVEAGLDSPSSQAGDTAADSASSSGREKQLLKDVKRYRSLWKYEKEKSEKLSDENDRLEDKIDDLEETIEQLKEKD